MPRTARIVIPHHAHHVIQRGNRRQDVFFQSQDYVTYLELMAEQCRKHQVRVWAYCLMPNHVHLVMVPETKEGLSRAVAEAHRQYAWRINRRNEWTGHLWQDRFSSYAMDESHLMSAVRYVELNPCDAGLVDSPYDWAWSSARAHLHGQDDKLVKVAPMLDMVIDWDSYLNQRLDIEKVQAILKSMESGNPVGEVGTV